MFGKKKDKREDNFLLYVPKRKHKTFEVRNEKVYLLFYHDKLIERFLRWLVRKPRVSDIEFDEIGSLVWLLIDDERSVYQIGQELREKLGERCEPLYERLIMYIRYLNKKGWIGFEKGQQ